MQVLEKTPDLTHLSLAKCRLLTDDAFRKISLVGRLTDLDLRHTGISTSAFVDVVQGCPNLVRVNVSSCKDLTGGLSNLTSRCDRLTFLICNKCEKMSPDDLLKGFIYLFIYYYRFFFFFFFEKKGFVLFLFLFCFCLFVFKKFVFSIVSCWKLASHFRGYRMWCCTARQERV